MDRIAASSKEFIHIPVATTTEGVDLEALDVEVALVATGSDPADEDYVTATWDDGKARVLIGRGTDIPLEPRRKYKAWVRITSDPEIPVVYSGEIETY